MTVHAFVYDSTAASAHVETVLERLRNREEVIEVIDMADGDPEEQRRTAILTVKNAVRIGSLPDELYGPDGTPDFSAGVLITEAETGRRSMHVGSEAVEALEAEG
jgi:hypothetical protein